MYEDYKTFQPYLVGDMYRPLEPDVVESLLTEVRKHRLSDNGAPNQQGDYSLVLENFVREYLTPKRQRESQRDGQLSLEQQVLYGSLALLFTMRDNHRRNISRALEEKRELDTALILNHFDNEKTIDYIDVTVALLHDLPEDFSMMDPNAIKSYLLCDIKGRAGLEVSSQVEGDIKTIALLSDVMRRDKKKEGESSGVFNPEDYAAYSIRVIGGIGHDGTPVDSGGRMARIKISDKLAQSYEIDEREFLTRLGLLKDKLKSNPLTKRVRTLLLKGGYDATRASFSHLVDFAYRIAYDTLFLTKEKAGAFILNAIYKNLRVIDAACCKINASDYDPMLIRLKNMLVYRTIEMMIKPRIDYISDEGLVTVAEMKTINERVCNIQKEGNLFHLTGADNPSSIFIPLYRPADRGNKGPLHGLNGQWSVQLYHLLIFDRLFQGGYLNDVRMEGGELKHSGLFTFDWSLKQA